MGWVASLQHQGTGSIPGLAQWVKRIWCRLQLQLASDPWLGNSIWHPGSQKEKKKKEVEGSGDRRVRGNRGRGQNDEATSQKLLEPPTWEKQGVDPPLEPLERMWPYQPWFCMSCLQDIRENNSVVLRHSGREFFQQTQKTNIISNLWLFKKWTYLMHIFCGIEHILDKYTQMGLLALR